MVERSVGRRIHVIGNNGAGKTVLGARLAELMEAPLVQLDALNWDPGWVPVSTSDPNRFRQRLLTATRGDTWVAEGRHEVVCQEVFWDRLEMVVWLDLPMPQLLYRVLARAWRRSRRHELLWGSNYESFWRQFLLWRRERSLLWRVVAQHRAKRRDALRWMADPRWQHVRFVRLRSAREVRAFTLEVSRALARERGEPRPLPPAVAAVRLGSPGGAE